MQYDSQKKNKVVVMGKIKCEESLVLKDDDYAEGGPVTLCAC